MAAIGGLTPLSNDVKQAVLDNMLLVNLGLILQLILMKMVMINFMLFFIKLMLKV